MIKKLLAGAVAAALSTGLVQAETLGLMNGRVAVPDMEQGGVAVEAGFFTGDVDDDVGYENLAGRLNYQFSPIMTVFADYGQAEIDFPGGLGKFDGDSLGAGLFYYMPDQTTVPSVDVAVKASYHTADSERDVPGGTLEAEFTVLNVEVLFSGKEPISEAGMRWYASVGGERTEAEYNFTVNGQNVDDKETDLAVGGGVTLPFNGGLLYGGVRRVEELTYGAGFRYFFK